MGMFTGLTASPMSFVQTPVLYNLVAPPRPFVTVTPHSGSPVQQLNLSRGSRLAMNAFFDQNRLSEVESLDIEASDDQPTNDGKRIREDKPASDELANNNAQLSETRSADVDAAQLQNSLMPWHHIFDRRSIEKQPQPILFNEALQRNWFNSVQDCSKPGPFKVHDYFIDLKPESTGRTINAQVMAPCRLQKSGPAPVIVISPPGFVGALPLPMNQKFYDIQPYISFMKHFASMGYVAVGLFEHRGIVFEDSDLVDHKRDAEELKSIADQLLGDNSPIKEPILKDQIAVMGHSKGAKLSFYHAAIDPRVKLVLAIDPVNQGGPPWFVSKKFADHPVAPSPGLTPKDKPSLMDKVDAKAVILRAPPDMVNFDSRFNAKHFWDAFKGEGVYVDCKVAHGDWLFRQDLRAMTRRVFTAALMDSFHPQKPFASELSVDAITRKTPHLIKDVQIQQHDTLDSNPAKKLLH